jgi:dGTPase
MELQALWDKANSLRGCLARKRTLSSRRRHEASEEVLTIENQFIDDEHRLYASKTFRLLRGKTQVFTFPRNALIRSRQAHVMEVVGYAAIITEMLGLNVDLVRAAAIGHDMGHVPFGHQGEYWMQKAMQKPNFCHEVMGVVIAQKIERRGHGLNLTWHTLDAMMRHSGDFASEAMSPEARVLRYADKIAYIFHDINDILGRAKYPLSAEIISLANEFGSTQRKRTFTASAALIVESAELGRVSFEHSELGKKFQRLRKLMLDVYPRVTRQDVDTIMSPVLDFITKLNVCNPFLLLAMMTDEDAAHLASAQMIDMDAFNRTSISEIMPYLREIGDVDLCDPDLGWYEEAAGPVHVYRIRDGEEEYWWIARSCQEAEEMHRLNPDISGNLPPEAEIEVWQERDDEKCAVLERFVGDEKVHEMIYPCDLDIENDFLGERSKCIIKTYGQWAKEKGRGFFNSTV